MGKNKENNKGFFVWDNESAIKPTYIFALAVSLVLLVLSIMYSSNSATNATYSVAEGIANSNYIYAGVYLNSYPIGGLTKEQALERASTDIADLSDWKFEIFTPVGFYSKEVNFKEAGAYYDFEKSINDGFNYGRKGNTRAKAATINELLNKHYYIDINYGYDIEKLKSFMTQLEPEINKEMQPYGQQLDLDRAVEMIGNNLEIKVRDFSLALPSKSL